MDFLSTTKEKARTLNRTIVLPEAEDERVIEAAKQILKEGIANVILIGNVDVAGATIIVPEKYEKLDELSEKLAELRKSKGMVFDEAKALLSTNSLYLGAMLVKEGIAHGMVAGAVNSTPDVMRAALQVVKTAPGTKLVSTFFAMLTNSEFGENGNFIFADCALNQNPTAEELAQIAVDSAKSFEALFGKEAIVAMLSHSTMGSAKHEDVTKVTQATTLAKELSPNLKLDGELQLDAAIIPSIGKSKAPNSSVAGVANVLVFPDIDAGNIGYKLVQRFGGAEAIGPITQGLSKPVNDLSRGCSVEDVVAVVALTALQG
ncbi:MAG: phosphate acetyltransferase [Defluviitaleaceae bacterium]|nr:phosphate acetyltransferase [Defluviitaleaceae bacterium]